MVSQPPPPWNGPGALQRAPDDDEREPVAARERHAAGRRSTTATPGSVFNRWMPLADHPLDALGSLILRPGQRHPHGQNIARIEAGLDVRERQRPCE